MYAAGRGALTTPHGPVRVNSPLSTAVATAPRSYYTRLGIPFQGRILGEIAVLCIDFIRAVLSLRARRRFCVSSNGPGGEAISTPPARSGPCWKIDGEEECYEKIALCGSGGRNAAVLDGLRRERRKF